MSWPIGKKHSKEHNKKIAIACLGNKLSYKTRVKISLSKKGNKNPCYGKPAWNRGISPSLEARQKMSIANKGRIISEQQKKELSSRNTGVGNPMFGRSGKNAPNWQGGICRYPDPLGWTKTFKEQIRQRDNYKCQICGCPEVEMYRKLDVHHIDYDRENLIPDNLISLCLSCHIKTNFNREYWIELLMGKTYAC